MSESSSSWWVYIVRCSDGTLYTGITTNLEGRVAAHNSQKGAKYTSTRTPVVLVWSQPSETRSTASKEEIRIKRLTRSEKLALIDNLIL
jgi:putative endonuclease